MGSSAFLFPGQGSQYVGMGKDLFEGRPEARKMFGLADEILGVPLSSISFDGPGEELKQTKNTQPAIFLHSMVLSTLYQKSRAAMAAGHSLGEYSALVYSGALTFEDGLRLVRLRGELMQQAGLEKPGTMAAIMGLDPPAVEAICKEASAVGIVQPANFNSPGQIVISGSVEGVRNAMERARAAGARLVKELQVSGAFHSPLMEPAREGLKKALEKTDIKDASIPVFTNVTAGPVQGADEIRNRLNEQLTHPVRWEESVRNMVSRGAETFIEIGPGKVLQGLVKRIHPEARVSGVEKLADLG